MKIQVYQDGRGEWRWRAVADNGRIVADSAEGYLRKSDCIGGVQVVADGMRKALDVVTKTTVREIRANGPEDVDEFIVEQRV